MAYVMELIHLNKNDLFKNHLDGKECWWHLTQLNSLNYVSVTGLFLAQNGSLEGDYVQH